LALCDTFLHVIDNAIVLGAKEVYLENDVKAAVGRILEMEWTVFKVWDDFRFHPNTRKERLLISSPAKERQIKKKKKEMPINLTSENETKILAIGLLLRCSPLVSNRVQPT
jgi:hypothetical protein